MKQRLQVGDTAPLFEVRDVNGRCIALQDYAKSRSHGYTLVAFLRYAGCPWCNLAIHRLTMETPLLDDNGCSVVAFVQSSKRNIVANIFERHSRKPDFPIIADQSRRVYGDYGVMPSLARSLQHLTNIPHWVHAVRKEGFRQSSIDGNLFLAPAMFLVSARDGAVIQADYGANLYEHDTFSRLYESIAVANRRNAID